MKKAQSISINTIIIAAIALAVLVVLFMVFTGKIGNFVKTSDAVTSCQQTCKATAKTNAPLVDENQDCTLGQEFGGFVTDSGVRKKCCCQA